MPIVRLLVSHSKNTHDTRQCYKLNKDGTPKGGYGKRDRSMKTKFVSMHQADDEANIAKAYEKLKKQHSAMMKRKLKRGYKKHGRRGKKRRYYSNSSNSSDSDSE